MSIFTRTLDITQDGIPTIVTFDMRRFSGMALNPSVTHPNKYTLKICLDCGEAVYVNSDFKGVQVLINISEDMTHALIEFNKQA